MELDTIKTLLTVASIGIAFYFGLKTANRNATQDITQDKTHVAKLDAGLDEIGRDIKDLKGEMSRMREMITEENAQQKRTEAQVEHLSFRIEKLEEDVRTVREICSLKRDGDCSK